MVFLEEAGFRGGCPGGKCPTFLSHDGREETVATSGTN